MEIRTMQNQNIIDRPSPTWALSFAAFTRDIKISHSIFALPFVATGLLFAKIQNISKLQIVLIIVAMVSARSFAMGMNRFLDRDVDGENVRTLTRAIPKGNMTSRQCLFWSLCFGMIFVCTAFELSPMAGILSLPLLVILASYSLMKRVSWITHWYLGACLGLAPIAAQIALSGRVSVEVVCVAVAVMLWTAGFDLLYSLQDASFDRSQGLFSVAAVFGHRTAIYASRLCFTGMVLLLVLAGSLSGGHLLYWIGVTLVGMLLFWEHWIIRDALSSGISKNINSAFFTTNAVLSLAFYAFVQLDFLLYAN